MIFRRRAQELIRADSSRSRRALIARFAPGERRHVAQALKKICYEVWTEEPATARSTARALADLARASADGEIHALAAWTAGIADLTRGRLGDSIGNLERAASDFHKLGKEIDAAQTKIAKMMVLALLGRYREAMATGRAALRTFEKAGDVVSAGKVEKNLGNVSARHAGLAKAEKYYLSALRRFEAAGDVREAAMCETNLADHYAEVNDFVRAEEFYELALRHARAAGLTFVVAETEATIGNLSLHRGRYADALKYLETARRTFERLRVAHRTAVADLDIAEVYRRLNLANEASVIYASAANRFRKLRLPAEEAQTRVSLGRTSMVAGDIKRASKELARAAELLPDLKNPSVIADVRVANAELLISRGEFASALRELALAGRPLVRAGSLRHRFWADWLRGECFRLLGRRGAARRVFEKLAIGAAAIEHPEIVRASHVSLGGIALASGDRESARSFLERAVAMTEKMRSPLAGEQFRMAYFADKLAPFEMLTSICLDDGDFESALRYVEQGRARTLAESLDGGSARAPGASEAVLIEERDRVREELNWFYSRLARAGRDDAPAIERELRKRERTYDEISRRVESSLGTAAVGGASFDADRLSKSLGRRRALVEFAFVGEEIVAFVVTTDGVRATRTGVGEKEVFDRLEALRFQFGSLRYGTAELASFLPSLKARADAHLEALYGMLVAPIASEIGDRDLVVVPAGAIHYVPFHALRADGMYLVESREISYAPSASIWDALAGRPRRAIGNALLIGVADEMIPLVEREIDALAAVFPDSEALRGENATYDSFRRSAHGRDLVHFACHGAFRPENPMFSSLTLADGKMTVRDLCAQRFDASIVTLSACETGLSKIYAGDEVLGLSRGFLAAGADSVVLSLWTVNDEATAELMCDLYGAVVRGASPAEALREAQLNMIDRDRHPYFWSPFFVIGR